MTITAEIAATIAWMIATYHANSAADEYWFGFSIDGHSYIVPNIGWDRLVAFFKPDYTSHRKGHKFILRVRATADECRALIPEAICIGDEKTFTRKVRNAGDGLEVEITERFTAEKWVKHDSAPFFEKGDVTVNGKQVQAKLNGATLTTECFLRKHFG